MDEYEFEIVSDDLTAEEKKILQKKLVHTCISLNIKPNDE